MTETLCIAKLQPGCSEGDVIPNDPNGRNRNADATDASGEASDGTAGWQKAMWIVGVLVLLAVGVLLATGDHGPARHAPDNTPQQDADIESRDDHDPSQFDH